MFFTPKRTSFLSSRRLTIALILVTLTVIYFFFFLLTTNLFTETIHSPKLIGNLFKCQIIDNKFNNNSLLDPFLQQLQHSSSSRVKNLSLWPEDSPDDDRIVSQLLYRPPTISTCPKKVHLISSDNDWSRDVSKGFSRCAVSSCQFTANWLEADLLFFKSSLELDMHQPYLEKRPKNQIWAQFQLESPAHSDLQAPPLAINWTVTYRSDSEIATPYAKFYHTDYVSASKGRQVATNKTKMVAWFVSNCDARNTRLEFARELAKHVQVDIYGECGPLECPRGPSDTCFSLLARDYKFYLSLENSNCRDYITEKLWQNALRHDVIPIVMGAHPDTYRALAPPHSYIHVEDFPNARALAHYLHVLDTNETLFREYFAWRHVGRVEHVFMWCRVCALMHAPHGRVKMYENLSAWWKGGGKCVHDKWNNS